MSFFEYLYVFGDNNFSDGVVSSLSYFLLFQNNQKNIKFHKQQIFGRISDLSHFSNNWLYYSFILQQFVKNA